MLHHACWQCWLHRRRANLSCWSLGKTKPIVRRRTSSCSLHWRGSCSCCRTACCHNTSAPATLWSRCSASTWPWSSCTTLCVRCSCKALASGKGLGSPGCLSRLRLLGRCSWCLSGRTCCCQGWQAICVLAALSMPFAPPTWGLSFAPESRWGGWRCWSCWSTLHRRWWLASSPWDLWLRRALCRRSTSTCGSCFRWVGLSVWLCACGCVLVCASHVRLTRVCVCVCVYGCRGLGWPHTSWCASLFVTAQGKRYATCGGVVGAHGETHA